MASSLKTASKSSLKREDPKVPPYKIRDKAMLRSPYLNPDFLPSQKLMLPTTSTKSLNTAKASNKQTKSKQPAPPLPEGFNNEFNVEDRPVTLKEIASLFRTERHLIHRNVEQNSKLTRQVEKLKEERDMIAAHYRAKADELTRQRKTLDEQIKVSEHQAGILEKLKTDFESTQVKLEDYKEEYERLNVLSQELPKLREQRDALVHTLELLGQEKDRVLEKFDSENQQQANGTNAGTTTAIEQQPKQQPQTQPQASQALNQSNRKLVQLDIPLLFKNTKMTKSLDNLKREMETNLSELKHVEVEIAKFKAAEVSQQDPVQLMYDKTNLLDKLKRVETERLRLKVQLFKARPPPPGPVKEDPVMTKRIKELEDRYLSQQNKFLDLQERYYQLTNQHAQLKSELDKTKEVANEADSLRKDHRGLIEALAREKELKTELDKVKLEYVTVNKELNQVQHAIQNSQKAYAHNETKLKDLESEKSKLESRVNDLSSQLTKTKKQYDETVTEFNKLKKSLEEKEIHSANIIAQLEQSESDNFKLQRELAKLKEDDTKTITQLQDEKTKLEGFVFTLKRQLVEKIESIKKEQAKLELMGDEEKELLSEVRMDEEALLVNAAFLASARKSNEKFRVEELLLQQQKLEHHRAAKEAELERVIEKKRAQEYLLQELKLLRDYKAQHDALVTTVEKARAANKLVLVTPQGVITTTMAELKRELLQVSKKREDVEAQLPLSDGWERLIDPSGKTLYVNPRTKVVQWTHPSAKDAAHTISRHVSELKNLEQLQPLQDGWEEIFDEKHGKFYVNKKTKETTFIDPRVTSSVYVGNTGKSTTDNALNGDLLSERLANLQNIPKNNSKEEKGKSGKKGKK